MRYYFTKAEELQAIFESGDMRKYHAELKLHLGTPLTKYSAKVVHKLSGIKSKDGITCHYDENDIINRWYEHFDTLF